MGAVRMLLPGARLMARIGGWPGEAVLGGVLLRCAWPRWVLKRLPAAERRGAWAGEAVAVYRRRPRHRDGLARALALYAKTLSDRGRYEEALTAADESIAVADARRSPTQTGYTLRTRALALLGAGRLDEALMAAEESVSHGPRGRASQLCRITPDIPAGQCVGRPTVSQRGRPLWPRSGLTSNLCGATRRRGPPRIVLTGRRSNHELGVYRRRSPTC